MSITLDWKGLLFIALVLLGVVGVASYEVHKVKTQASFSQDSLVLAKKGLEVALAGTSASKDSLKVQLDAAKALNGTLISGVNIHVKQPSVSDTLVKPISTDGDTAFFVDTSNIGVLRARVNCNPRFFAYHFDLFQLDISVGEVQLKNDSAVFVVRVSQRGVIEDSVAVKGAFAQKVVPFKRLKYFVAGYYNPFGPYWDGEAGAQWQVPLVNEAYLTAEAWQPLVKGQNGQFLIGVRKEF